jgi:hypothetical protein
VSLAAVAAAGHQYEHATRLLGAADAICASIGVLFETSDEERMENASQAARQALSGSAYEAAWDEGEAMGLEEAVTYVGLAWRSGR